MGVPESPPATAPGRPLGIAGFGALRRLWPLASEQHLSRLILSHSRCARTQCKVLIPVCSHSINEQLTHMIPDLGSDRNPNRFSPYVHGVGGAGGRV